MLILYKVIRCVAYIVPSTMCGAHCQEWSRAFDGICVPSDTPVGIRFTFIRTSEIEHSKL